MSAAERKIKISDLVNGLEFLEERVHVIRLALQHLDPDMEVVDPGELPKPEKIVFGFEGRCFAP